MRFNNKKIIYCVLLLASLLLSACGGDVAPGEPAAIITTQPTDQSVVAGTAATFNALATNATGYQWQSSTDGGTTFANVNLATAASFTTALTTLADSGTMYRVLVSGAGNSVTSSAVTLTVSAIVLAPSISVHPAAQTIIDGQNVSFSVTAGGTSISYQWQRSTDGGASFTDVAGAANATLALTAVALADNAHQFRVVVSNSAGSVTSDTALLTVDAAQVSPAISTQPASITVVAPNTAAFTVAATGSPSQTLQWQLSTNSGSSFADIAGATASSYTTAATNTGDSGKQYRVIATNASGTATSAVATLTVNAAAVAPAFTSQPANATIIEGQNAQFVVAASGTPTPTLQWQLSTDSGANWSNINGETGTTFDALNVALGNNGRQFRAVATNSAGSVNSSAATLTVTAAPPAHQMISARVNHTATLLTNGKVLVAAGIVNVSSGGFFASAELYDPATSTWSATGSLATARGHHTATLLSNGKVLVTGGMGVNPAGGVAHRLASAELYDPATNTWSAVDSLVTARAHHTATLLTNGKVLVAGGSSNNSNLPIASAELFDPATNTWSAAASFLVERQTHEATLLPNGRVLLVGGNNNVSGSLSSVELYDPVANTWSTAANMALARDTLSATLLANGKVLAAGGWSHPGIGIVASAELYDPATNTWSAVGNLVAGRYSHTATLLANGKVLVAAGYGSSLLASAELFDPATNTWSATGGLTVARYYHSATRLANGNVLVAAGVTTANANTARSELYDVAINAW